MTKTSFPTPSRPYLYLPDGWDTGWKAAKASIATTPAGILFEGDSNTLGNNASNFMTTSFPFVMRASLAATYGAHADYYGAGMANSGTLPFTTGGGAAMNSGGPAVFNRMMTNQSTVAIGAAGDWSFTTPYACTAIDIIMQDPTSSTGTWQYNVDNAGGTGLTTITTPGFNNGTFFPYRTAITGLANTTHTVRGGNATTGFMSLLGAVTYTGTTGGLSFAYVAENGQAGSLWGPTAQSLQGYYKTSLADTSHLTGFGFPAQPSLAIIQWGINDCQLGYSVDAYRDSLRALVSGIRRGTPNASIIMLCTSNPDARSDQTLLWANPDNYPMFMSTMFQIAQFYNCAFVNIHAKWGSNPVARGFATTADQHPNDAGYADIAATILGIL